MRRRTLIAAAAFVLSTSLAAHADSFALFNLNSPISGGGTLAGTINLDLTAGNALDSTIDLTYTNGATSTSISGAAASIAALGSIGTELVFNESTGHVLLSLMTSTPGSLAGYTGGGLCTLANVAACGGSPSILALPPFRLGVDLVSGDLTPAAATPEPSSFVLLGSAMLGLAGLARRRFV